MSFPEQPFGFVAGRWVLSIGDTPDDADRAPDYVPVKDGTVVFTPQVSHRVATDGSGWAGIIKDRVSARVGERGQLVDAEGHDHLALAVGVYSVSYDFGLDRSWPSHYIEVKQEHTAEAPLWLPPITPAPEGPMIENRVITIPADGADGQVLVWDGGGFSWMDAPEGSSGEITPEALMEVLEPILMPVFENLAMISPDMTVGTRAILHSPDGNAVTIYGDTGWREVTSLCEGVESGTVFIRRTAAEVQWRFWSVVLTPGSGTLQIASTLPYEWGPANWLVTSTVVREGSMTHRQNIAVEHRSLSWISETSLLDGGTTTTRPEEPIYGIMSVPAYRNWPVAQIGTPYSD